MGKTKKDKDKKKKRVTDKASMLIATQLAIKTNARLAELKRAIKPNQRGQPTGAPNTPTIAAIKMHAKSEADHYHANTVNPMYNELQAKTTEAQMSLAKGRAIKEATNIEARIYDVGQQSMKELESLYKGVAEGRVNIHESKARMGIIKDNINRLLKEHPEYFKGDSEHAKLMNSLLTQVKASKTQLKEANKELEREQDNKMVQDMEDEIDIKRREITKKQYQTEALKINTKNHEEAQKEEYAFQQAKHEELKARRRKEHSTSLLKTQFETQRMIREKAALSESEKAAHKKIAIEDDLDKAREENARKLYDLEEQRKYKESLNNTMSVRKDLERRQNTLHGEITHIKNKTSGYSDVDEISKRNDILERLNSKMERSLAKKEKRFIKTVDKAKQYAENQNTLKQTARNVNNSFQRQLEELQSLPPEDKLKFYEQNQQTFHELGLDPNNENHISFFPALSHARSSGKLTKLDEHPFGFMLPASQETNGWAITNVAPQDEFMDRYVYTNEAISIKQEGDDDDEIFEGPIEDWAMESL